MKDKITIYLCDDDYTFIAKMEQKLKTILESEQRDYEILTFTNGGKLTETFKHYFADAVFLDIDMPNMSGFEVSKQLREIKEDVHIIFVTAHEEMVFQSYEFHPFWFVRKTHLDDLDIVLPRLLLKIDTKFASEHNLFKLVTENKIIEIDINSVKYIKSHDHYISLKNSDGTEKLERCKISDVEKQLFPLYFVRIQKSVIINCRFISKITSRSVILHGSEKINISRDKIDFVKNEFQRYMRSI